MKKTFLNKSIHCNKKFLAAMKRPYQKLKFEYENLIIDIKVLKIYTLSVKAKSSINPMKYRK